MSKRINLGKVEGKNASINSNEITNISTSSGINMTDSGNNGNFAMSMDTSVVQEKLTGTAADIVSFDSNGSAKAMELEAGTGIDIKRDGNKNPTNVEKTPPIIFI